MVRKFFVFFVGFLVYMIVVFGLMALGWKYANEAGLTDHWPVPVLMLVLLCVLIGLPPVLYSRHAGRTSGWQRRLLQGGLEAPARILEVADTGVSLGNPDLSYFVVLTLAVQPTDHPPFTAKVDQYVSRASVPRAGDRLRVRFDPADLTKVVIVDESTAPVTGAAPASAVPDDMTTMVTALRDASRAGQGTTPGIQVVPLSGDDPAAQVKALMETLGASRATVASDPADRIAKLDALRQGGLLTDDEYTARRRAILDAI